MKIAERRKRILMIYAIVVAGALFYGLEVFAEEAPPPAQSQGQPEGKDGAKGEAKGEPKDEGKGNGAKSDQPVPWPDAYQERRIPFQRELSAEDYEWLGRTVWESLQKIVPGSQNRGLSSREIHALVLEMRRNRNEFTVQLEDLFRILSTRSKRCGRRDAVENNDFIDGERRESRPISCDDPKPQPGSAWGFDLERLKKPQH